MDFECRHRQTAKVFCWTSTMLPAWSFVCRLPGMIKNYVGLLSHSVVLLLMGFSWMLVVQIWWTHIPNALILYMVFCRYICDNFSKCIHMKHANIVQYIHTDHQILMSIYTGSYFYMHISIYTHTCMFNVIQTTQAPLLPAASTHIKHHQTMALKRAG